MEQDVRVAGGTADIETGQLLVIKRCMCHIAFCNYKCVNIGFFPVCGLLYIHVLSITMNPHTAHNHSRHYTMQSKALSVPYYLL